MDRAQPPRLSTGQQRILRIVRQLVVDGAVQQPERGPAVYALSIDGRQRALSSPVSITRPGDLVKWPDAMQKLARDELARGGAGAGEPARHTAVVVQHRARGRPTEYMTVAL